MQDITYMQRSRLKLTIVAASVLFVMGLFPMWVILKATGFGIFDLAAPWVYLGTVATTIGLVFGYYINKESSRPSLIGGFFGSQISPIKKLMKGEDESDPEDMPL